jgi:hypothetical protein
MVSGIGTSSGFEERIRFSEIEIVDSNAIDTGVLHTVPEGNYINNWDVNVAGVRVVSVKRNIRYHKHAQFLLRIKKKGELEHFVGRRYGDFVRLHKRLRSELPGRVLPALPKKNKSHSTTSAVLGAMGGGAGSDASSISSTSTRLTTASQSPNPESAIPSALTPRGHGRNSSVNSVRSRTNKGTSSPRPSVDGHLSPGLPPWAQGKQEVGTYRPPSPWLSLS